MNNNGRGMFRVNCDLRPDPNVTARKRQENEFKNSPLYRTHFDWDPRYSDLQTRGDRNGNRRKAVRERSLEMTFLPIKPPTNIHDLKFPKPKVRP